MRKVTVKEQILAIVVSALLFLYIHAMMPITSYKVLDYLIGFTVSIIAYSFLIYAMKLDEDEF